MSIQIQTRFKISLILMAISAALTGCVDTSDSQVVNETTLPIDARIDLPCADAGLVNSDCILTDPNNPYARVNVNNETKWQLDQDAPSAKSRFYLWATALAKTPIGENQYYTAVALHALYSEGGSPNAQSQAKKAYRTFLDQFYNEQSYYWTASLDYIPDTDFNYGEYGSGSSLEGNYREDTDYQPVFQVIHGNSWGAPTAALSLHNFETGFSQKYETLVFKIKNLPTENVYVKFSMGANTGTEQALSLADYGTALEDKTDWTQVKIPLTLYPELDQYTEFGIFGGYGNGGTLLITDLGFEGDTTGNGLYKDKNNDGLAALYQTNPDRVQVAYFLRNPVGFNLISPSNGLAQLFASTEAATAELNAWGYQFNSDSSTLSQK